MHASNPAFCAPPLLPRPPLRCRARTTPPRAALRVPPRVALALDVGTSGTKAGVFCADTGALLALSSAPHATHAAGAARTQRLADWRQSVGAAVRGALAEVDGRVEGEGEVAVLAVTGSMQNFAQVAGAPVPGLGEEVVLYSDLRAVDVGRRLGVAADGLLAKMAWVGEVGEGVRVGLGAADVIVFEACGELVTDATNLSTTGLSLPPHRRYDVEGMREAGVDAWAGALPTVLGGPPRVVGAVRRVWAEMVGVERLAGVPVVHAGGDAGSTTIGAGCGEKGGGSYVYIGTSGWVGRVVGAERVVEGLGADGVFYLADGRDVDCALEFGSLSCAGACFAWAAESLLGGLSVEKMLTLATTAPVGANGVRTGECVDSALCKGGCVLCLDLEMTVVFFPWLAGRRCPRPSASARASFQGISSGTTTSDVARAVVEGVAYGVRACLEAGGGFEGCGSGADGILRIVGGGAQSPLVCEIMASVLGRPLQLGPQASVGVTGAAVSGLAAIGIEEGMLRSRHGSPNREDVIYRPRGVEQGKYDSLYNESFTID